MIHKRKIEQLIRNKGKRPSKNFLFKLDNLLKKYAEENIERAKRNADFAGRKTLLEEDL